MIYITGDTHGYIDRFKDIEAAAEGGLKKDDYIIICGDFGFIFRTRGTMDYIYERENLDILSKKPYTILFVDGNHENFDRLDAFGVEEWHGGRVHRIRPNILHLMRGQIFEIEGKTFYTMGGGYSRDKYARREGYSWWSGELPTQEELLEGLKNLKEANYAVDVVITHTAPARPVAAILKEVDEHEKVLTEHLTYVMENVRFDKWFFGHFHEDAQGIRLHNENIKGEFNAMLDEVYKL